MNFDIGEVLTRAWQITWKNKVLWGISILPFLILFLMFPIWLFFAFGIGLDSNKLDRLVENQAFWIIGIVIYSLIMLGSLTLQIISHASATLGIYRAETDGQPITFIDLLKDGTQYFWRILGVGFIIGFVMMAFFLAIFTIVAGAAAVTMGIAIFCIQPFFILMIPLMLIVMAFMEQAESAVVADEMSVVDALARAYELIKANVWKYVLVTVVVYFGMNILLSLVMFPLMMPMFFIMMRNFDTATDLSSIFRMQAVFGIIVFPIMALIQGFSLTYLKSAMMVTYLRLTRSSTKLQPALQGATA